MHVSKSQANDSYSPVLFSRDSLTWRIERIAYRAQQASLLLNGLVLERIIRKLTGMPIQRAPRSVQQLLRKRLHALYARDLDNVERGHYPRELLFQFPFGPYLRALPRLLLDVPNTVRRMREGDYKDLPEDVSLDPYPPYYRRTFHWQTDGYLSDRSAAMYDIGVELLFKGTADVMRRQVIPPISQFVRGRTPESVRLLDVACGTGRTLRQLAVAHPRLQYHGVDLSPFYARAARDLLADVDDVHVRVANAEQLPYPDAYFDVVTSVYLFHELPRNARRRVLREAYRVLRPGGLLVLEDSAQASESQALTDVLGAFPEDYHEPFYRDYIRDDLGQAAAACGFDVSSTEPHMVAKVVIAYKPA